MNYLQMYINLSLVFFVCIILSCALVASAMESNSKAAKIGAFIVLLVFVVLTIFCAAMAGLLS